MEYLKKLYETNPYLRCISLEHRGINDLARFVPVLAKFRSLEDLDLSFNPLTSLPADLSSLKGLKSLTLNEACIDCFENLLNSLKTLPNIKILHVTSLKTAQMQELFAGLPKLESINGKPRNEEAEKTEPLVKIKSPMAKHMVEPNGIVKEDIESAERIFNVIKDLRTTMDSPLATESSFCTKKEAIISNTMKEATRKGSSVEKRAISLKGKFELFNTLLGEIGTVVPNNVLCAVLGLIRNAQFQAFDELCKTFLSVDYQTYMDNMKDSSKQMNELIELAHKADVAAKKCEKEKQELESEYKKTQLELAQEVETLRAENRKYLEKLVRHAKDTPSSFKQRRKSASPTKSTSIYPPKPSPIRALTLKQLKETIHVLFNEKKKFDHKCRSTNQPIETLEQYMYTYLNKQYGLKSIILEWANAIFEGIKAYSAVDAEVNTFGKILKNECDEEFWWFLHKVKLGVENVIKSVLREKFRYKSEDEIGEKFKELSEGNTLVDGLMQQETLNRLFLPEDAEIVRNRITKVAIDKKPISPTKSPKRCTKFGILYEEFTKVILDFYSAKHDQYLNKLLQTFKAVDTDNNGILNESEFIEFVKNLGINEIEYLLRKADPLEKHQITFSQCIAIFTAAIP